MDLHCFSDIHSHRLDADAGTVINLPPDVVPFGGDARFSVGVHPWDTVDRDAAERMFAHVEAVAADPRVVAIGETGLDALRGAPLAEQEELFLRHALLAERLGKPLIIHAVRTAARIAALCRDRRPSVPWIIHGFRGNPVFARQLVDAGLSLSLGPRHNPAVVDAVPAHRLYRETDAPRLQSPTKP